MGACSRGQVFGSTCELRAWRRGSNQTSGASRGQCPRGVRELAARVLEAGRRGERRPPVGGPWYGTGYRRCRRPRRRRRATQSDTRGQLSRDAPADCGSVAPSPDVVSPGRRVHGLSIELPAHVPRAAPQCRPAPHVRARRHAYEHPPGNLGGRGHGDGLRQPRFPGGDAAPGQRAAAHAQRRGPRARRSRGLPRSVEFSQPTCGGHREHCHVGVQQRRRW
mmetsp:Transcript_12847/g.30180  ORF Transcript_12847/g.30180 Transcript_12847/m.30180 type:complete len:221 (-) Transcript_12847:981-1643(-)